MNTESKYVVVESSPASAAVTALASLILPGLGLDSLNAAIAAMRPAVGAAVELDLVTPA